MSDCNSCKLVSMGKGREALCYDCLEAERDAHWPQVLIKCADLESENKALREAAQAVVDDNCEGSVADWNPELSISLIALAALLGVQT